VEQDLDLEEWALLGFIHRYTHGGPTAPGPTSPSFADAYAILIGQRLIEHAGDRGWVITEHGDRALRLRYAER
jgi:hypothetical protein